MVVLSLFKRPHNLSQQIEAVNNQNRPAARVAVVDCAPESPFISGIPVWDYCAENMCTYWRFPDPGGPPSRFAPAFMEHDCSHIWFIDDDILPNPRALQYLIETARNLEGRYATIGEIGRRFHSPEPGTWHYKRRNIRRRRGAVPVDMTARSHFVETKNMRHVLNLKWQLIDMLGDDAMPLIRTHDDILLCDGIRRGTGYVPVLTPANDTAETNIRGKDLPANNSCSSRPNFIQERNRLITAIRSYGPTSL